MAAPTVSPEEGFTLAARLAWDTCASSHIEWAILAAVTTWKLVRQMPESYMNVLVNSWKELCRTHATADCPKVKLPTKRQAQKRLDLRKFVGFCMCRPPQLREFVTRLQKWMRQSCPKNSTNLMHAKHSQMVLRLSGCDGLVHWYHICYTNFSTWVSAIMPLVPAECEMRACQSEACGFIALDLKSPVNKCLGVNHWWSHLRSLDFKCVWNGALYVLRDDDAVPERDFIPAELEVRSLIPTAQCLLWSGEDDQKLAPPRRKRDRFSVGSTAKGPSKKRAAGSASPVRESESDASGQAPPSDDSIHVGGSGNEDEGSGFDTHDSWLSDVNAIGDDGSPSASDRDGSGFADSVDSRAASDKDDSGKDEAPAAKAAAAAKGKASASKAKAPARKARRGKRRPDDIWWGPFRISKIESAGVQTGWGIECFLHKNCDNDTECKKTLNYTGRGGKDPLDDDGIILRLKRWTLLGFDIDAEKTGEQQQIAHRDVCKVGTKDMLRTQGYVEGEDDDPPMVPDRFLHMVRDDREPGDWQ